MATLPSSNSQQNLTEPHDEAYRKWIFTVPNVICMLRAVGSVGMLAFAIYGHRYWFVSLFVLLTLSDWIDGPLARWMRQRSEFGARIDSFADSLLYAAFLSGSTILCYETLAYEFGWILSVVVSYILTSGLGLMKYGRIPSYHTQAAKKSQFIVLIGGVVLVLGGPVWPARLAALAVTLTNIETCILTTLLPTWHADVSSLWYVLRNRAKYFSADAGNSEHKTN